MKKYEFFAYNPPTSGIYRVNGYDYKNPEDFRSVKRCKEYKNCGFDKLQLRYEHAYSGEPWEESNTKLMWDVAYFAGIKRMLVTDLRLDRLVSTDKLVGDGCLFKNENELDEKISELVSVYKDKPGFYGIQLNDEPKYHMIKSYGLIARSLKRVVPHIYIQMNLNPICVKIDGIDDPAEAYEKYANEILDATGLDHVSFDDYPFRREYILSGWNLRNYQILARVCKQRNIELQTVLQSFSNTTYGIYRHRKITESDMYWQTNVAMGFGAREYAFYTYMPKYNIDYRDGGDGIDGSCFINNDGSRSALFYYTKRIIKEMKKFSEIACKYNYENSYFVTEKGKSIADYEQTILAEDHGKPPFAVETDKGVVLITEQKNDADRLFMIENIGNLKDELFNGALPIKVKFSLPEGKKTFYFKGKETVVKQSDGQYCVELKVGDAVFIEIKQ